MALPPYYPNLFTDAADWTFAESSEFPTPISGSYIITSGGYSVFNWTPDTTTAPGLAGISGFVPEVGRKYTLSVKMRKTSAVTNGVTSWVRPGFLAFTNLADYSQVVVIGPTSGLGLTAADGFIDTAAWIVNEWYEIICVWTPTIAYPLVRPRMRLNRNEADTAPYSDASYEIRSFEVLSEISIGNIRSEFGGPTPAKISNYYRKSILPAITANFADTDYTLYSFLESESGIHTTNFSNGVSHYTTDGGNFGPRNDLTFGLNEGSLSLVTDPVEGTVLQSQGVNWGGVVQGKGWGKVAYSKVEAGITYTVTVRKKLVTDPTNTEYAPKMYTQLWVYDASGHYIGTYNIPNASPLVLTVAGGWTNIVGTYTLAEITSYPIFANAVYVRPITYDNIYIYANNVGAYNVIACNCVVQTASFSTTPSVGTLKGIGLDKIYNITNGVDEVYVLNGTTWSIDSQQSIKDLGTPRQATNPYTKRIIRIGDFLVIDSPTTSRIPTSGTINFSDFLGSSQTAGPIFYTPRFLGTVDGNQSVSFEITAYSLSNSAITFSYDYLPGGLTNATTTANTVTINGETYNANTITFSGKSEYTYIPSYPIGWAVQASDPYITIERGFYYNNLNLTPTWVTSAGSLGTFANGSTVSVQLSATDPEGKPIEYTIANGGALPNNLTLSYTGLLSGTLSASVGTYPFSIRASDGPFYTDQAFSMVVEESAVPIWQTPSGQLAASGTGESYSSQLVADTATSYSIISGSLPTGMSLDTATGIISGTPTGTSQSQTSTTFKSFPAMTSDTSPAGYTAYVFATVTGTSTFTSNNVLQVSGPDHNRAYQAFDGRRTYDGIDGYYYAPFNGLMSGLNISFPVFIGVSSPYKVNVGSYSISAFLPNNSPKDWQLQGSNDGTNWTTLDTRSNISSWAYEETKSFTLAASVSYYYYRLYVTDMVEPTSTYMFISEISFYDYASVFTVRATGANGLYSDRDFGISVHAGATSVSWNSPLGALGDSTGGTAYSFTANTTVVNAVGSTVYSVQSGSLPSGTSLDTATGSITGTLTNTPSSYSFTLRATNNGVYAERVFTGSVISPPVWQTASGQLIPAGTGESYSTQLVANTATTYSIISGSLPTGMSLDTATGIVSGTPTGTSQSQSSTTFKSFPYMTSDTSPTGYTAYALSTIYGTSTLTSNNALQNPNTAYYAFDGLDNLVAFTFAYQTYGFSFPLVLGMTAPHKVNVGSYDIKGYSFGVENTSTLKAWQLQGSDDGVNWVTVDTRSNITSWTTGYSTLSFTLSTAVSYYQYRIYITEQGVMPSPSGLSPVLVMEITFKDYASVFTVRATAANGLYVDRDFGISVHTGATSVSWNSPAAGALGESTGGTSYSFTANTSVVNAVGSTVYSVLTGSIPAGTTLNTANGAITGTLTNASSSYSFTIRATNNGISADRPFTGTVVAVAPPSWQTASGQLVGAQTGQSYTTQLVANTATTYSIVSGSLPTGMSLDSSTGIITGTPTGTSQSQTATTFKSFPAMTSDTSPAGYTAYVFATVTGTSTFTSNAVLQVSGPDHNRAYQAFDGRITSAGGDGYYVAPFNGLGPMMSWSSISFPVFIGVSSPYKVNVGSYSISAFMPNNSPKSWQLQGSNDGTNWTTLDTRSNISSWAYEETKSFTLAVSVSYYYYRLYITDMVEPTSTYMFISEISFYDYASVFTVRATAANGLSSDRQFGISVQ